MTIASKASEAPIGRGSAPLSFIAATRLASRAPHWLLYAVSRVGGAIHYCLSVEKRRNYLANTRPLGRRPRHRPWHAFQNQALNVLELLKAVSQDGVSVRNGICLHGEEVLRSALERGRGLILATVHTGNWELSGLTLAGRGYPVTTVAGEQLRSGWSDEVRGLKERFGIHVVTPGPNLRHLVRDLHANRVVALHVDGDLFTGGLEVLFFERRVRVPRGPARLSRITGAPVAFAFCHRTGRKKLDIVIEDTATAPTTTQEENALTRRLVRRVERRISDAPGQWCIFRRIE